MSLASEGKLQAPRGQYRVIGVDTFEGPTADYHIGDYRWKFLAIRAAKDHAGEMNPVYVYDDKGRMVFNAGTP